MSTWTYKPVFADRLEVGDRCARSGEGTELYTVLRPSEPCEDLFGRTMFRYWCGAPDGSREGWMTFGPGGIAYRLDAPDKI